MFPDIDVWRIQDVYKESNQLLSIAIGQLQNDPSPKVETSPDSPPQKGEPLSNLVDGRVDKYQQDEVIEQPITS